MPRRSDLRLRPRIRWCGEKEERFSSPVRKVDSIDTRHCIELLAVRFFTRGCYSRCSRRSTSHPKHHSYQCCSDNTMLLPRLLRSSSRAITSIPRSQSSFGSRQLSSSLWRREITLADIDPTVGLPNIDPSQLHVTETITPKQLMPNEDLIFGRTFTG